MSMWLDSGGTDTPQVIRFGQENRKNVLSVYNGDGQMIGPH